MTQPPRIFTVPPGVPFLEVLAAAILRGDLPSPGGPAPDPLDLPAITILLPTRRAARALQEGFLKASGRTALLLPQIRPIAESDEDESLIDTLAQASGAPEAALSLPPAIGKLERQLVLMRLVRAWSQALQRTSAAHDGPLLPVAGAVTPAQAANLARELARLMDMIETENVAVDRLAGLVPETLSAHWQQTLDFLGIVTQHWPAFLAEREAISPVARRNRLLLAEAARLATRTDTGPLIVAGVTGSIPATAELMRAVAGLAQVAIVLPGLDLDLEAATWDLIGDRHPEHPQFGFHRLLARLGVDRADVKPLPGVAPTPKLAARAKLVGEMLRPSGTLEGWHRYMETLDRAALTAALADVSLIEAPRSEDEAEAVALILREALETPDRTAALVTPDRLLARRVAIRLESYGIRVDDSAGRPFAKTMPGTFLELVADAAAHTLAPADVMALLKHPLTRLGLPAGDIRRAARALEIIAFRTPYLGSGLSGLEAAVERAARETEAGLRRGRTLRTLGPTDWAGVRDLVARLAAAFAPLLAVSQAPPGTTHAMADLARAHVGVAEALACPPELPEDEPSPLWSGPAGETAARLMGELIAATASPEIAFSDYADLYRSLLAGESVRARIPVHPRLFIWGPMEARLQTADVVVLGGLNDGTWPQVPEPGPWLNRPMRAALGLPSPEEETGRGAHDLVSLLGADRVVLTRAQKVDGVPAVPSRWLLRLNALLGGLGMSAALEPDQPWLAWARARDLAPTRPPAGAPAPCPPLALRPRRLSVSDVETWLANPYAIYAAHVLGLEALPELGRAPGAAEKGQIIHEALSRFTRRYGEALPADIKRAFLAEANHVVQDLGAAPRVRAFWLPRLDRFATWFAATEPGRRQGITGLMSEVAGVLVLDAPGGAFRLSARADRIETTPAGLVITDYKTGQLPKDPKVLSGAAPQLPLEAAMAEAGAFTGIAAGPVAILRYISASGGEPPGIEHDVDLKGTDAHALAAQTRASLERLVAQFDDPLTPYKAVRRRRFTYTYDDYAHLARAGEWGGEGDEAEEDAS